VLPRERCQPARGLWVEWSRQGKWIAELWQEGAQTLGRGKRNYHQSSRLSLTAVVSNLFYTWLVLTAKMGNLELSPLGGATHAGE